MSPVDRIRWNSAVAAARLKLAARGVASVAADVARDGRLMHGTSAIAAAAGISYNSAAAGIDVLVRAGFLRLVAKARQHTPAVYELARVPRSGDPQTPKARGVWVDPGSHVELPRVPKSPSQGPQCLGLHEVQEVHEGRQRAKSPRQKRAVPELSEGIGPAFPTRDGGTWRLTVNQLGRLTAAHPAIDAEAELAKAALWCEASASRRKTRGGMLRFLAGWFARSRPAVLTAVAGLSEAEIDEMLSEDPAPAGKGGPRG